MADFTIITKQPAAGVAKRIAAEIVAGFRQVRADRLAVELDRRRAIDAIIRLAEPGDSVLIAGKGHETFQEFEDTVVPFDDRIYARESVEAHCGGVPRKDHASRH
ncbi:MAG: hypothetical protein U1G07_03325 [Verrucomicrobiota bacterium]